MALNSSYLIIGSGNFGAATALSLIGRNSTAQVTLVDSAPFPNPRAASHDINKIVRDDYPDPMYSGLMIKGMDIWRNSPLYSPFYHESGAMRADASNFSDQCMETYKKLGVRTEAHWITVEQAREKWGGVFATSAFSDLKKCFWNPRVGWAAAEQALTKVIETAIEKGVKYLANGASKLLFDDNGACIGAKLQDGAEVHADVVLVAAGAGTPLLLYQSDPSRKKLHVGERAVATGAVSFFGRWDDERRKKFKDVPVIKISAGGIKGEGMSVSPDGVIKFNCDLCFTNNQTLPDSTVLSVPPSEASKFTWAKDFPKSLKEIALKTMNGLYGENAKGVEIEGYRMCWDASTPTHDFLVTPHPDSKNLFIATGGSFHGWKFLPVIGDRIVEMFSGTLDKGLAERWAWDKDPSLKDRMAMPSYVTSGDMADYLDK